MKKRIPSWLGMIVLCAAMVVQGFGPGAPDQSVAAAGLGKPEVSAEVHHDTSPALRDVAPKFPATGSSTKRERGVGMLPNAGNASNEPDGALQVPPQGLKVGVTAYQNFDGLNACGGGITLCYAPPDTNGSVGLTQYFQWTNVSFQIFNKFTGASVLGPTAGKALWSGFGGDCENLNDGDPIVLFDKMANRWFLTQFAVSNGTSTGYLECIAVSTTSDATGTYYRYAYNYGIHQFNDYPKVGVWPDGYYITYNVFSADPDLQTPSPKVFTGPMVCALDRVRMLTGGAATQQCYLLSSTYGGVLPSDADGTTLPPSGAPNYMVATGTNALNLWRFHVDWTTPANTTFNGPYVIPVAAFSGACSAFTRGRCIPQSGTSQVLESLGDRLMFRAAYRNFGDHESIVVNQSVTAGSTPSGVRWYEIRNPNTTPSLYQGGTYGGDGTSRWMGSIAMDHMGNMLMGYSASSGSLFPSIAYTGRLVSDPINTMQGEALMTAGGGSQLTGSGNGPFRWGDYSSMSIDPSDDCTFWYTQEYLKTSGDFNWNSRIGSFKFPSCNGTPAAPPTPTNVRKAVANTSGVLFQWDAVYGSTYLAVSNGATVTNLPNPGSTTYFSPTAAGAWTCLSVVAANVSGYSSWSPWACGFARPPAPVISFLSRNTTSVTFSWPALPPSTAISISNGSTVQNFYGPTTFTQTGMTAGQWVCVSGLAYNSQENSAPWTGWVCGQAG